jgi:hypothetical protein
MPGTIRIVQDSSAVLISSIQLYLVYLVYASTTHLLYADVRNTVVCVCCTRVCVRDSSTCRTTIIIIVLEIPVQYSCCK